MFSETATGFRPVLRINLKRYIFKLMTHYMHSGLLMKTLVHFFSFFCTITGHTAERAGGRARRFVFTRRSGVQWVSGSSLFIRG